MRGFRRLSYSPTLPRTALFWARGWLVRPRGQLLGSTARAGPACTITRLPATEENQRSNKQSGVHLTGGTCRQAQSPDIMCECPRLRKTRLTCFHVRALAPDTVPVDRLGTRR